MRDDVTFAVERVWGSCYVRVEADYVIVGAGISGATIARMLADAGKHVAVVEARERVGGNCADVMHPSGFRYNLHGPHFFRTSSPRIQAFVERFAAFYPYCATAVTQVGGELFPWPLHRSTFDRFASVATPAPAEPTGRNFETAMLELLPPGVYHTFIAGYTSKQWGVPPTRLDADLAKRIEVREDDDLRFSKASFQGMPMGGYTAWVEAILDRIPVHLSTDIHARDSDVRWRRKLIYTGPIDRFFGHSLGPLPYRTQERVDLFVPGARSLYPCAQINLSSVKMGRHVRTIEWRHMLAPGEGPETGTLLTVETPRDATCWTEAEYPFPSPEAKALYQRYVELAAERPDVLFCGRMGEYRYLDMDQAIGRAMLHADRLLREDAE
ncbi:MAG: FAD-dependent oxidoreductase [Sphingomonas sp.]